MLTTSRVKTANKKFNFIKNHCLIAMKKMTKKKERNVPGGFLVSVAGLTVQTGLAHYPPR
jgi:hypothetical protein